MLRQSQIRVFLAMAVAGVSLSRVASADNAFIYTDNPVSTNSGTIQITGNGTASFTSLPIGYNFITGAQSQNVYWFKYISDGKSAVTFDTLGSDFGTYGPAGSSSGGGPVLGSYNQSEIAVYNAAGTLKAISQSVANVSGDPIYPWYNAAHTNTGPNHWYDSQGLSQLNLVPNPPTDPHWLVSPTSSTVYVGPSAPDNSGNAQTYSPPLNEYMAWYTSLEPVGTGSNALYYARDNNNNIVYSNGSPVAEQGWRYSDYARVGPGAKYNRAGALPAGTYYIAVSSGVAFAGDTYRNAILTAPGTVNYDPLTFTFGPAISTPLTFGQYYLELGDPTYTDPKYTNADGFNYYNGFNNVFGTVQLNVTQRLIGDLNGDGKINLDDYLALDAGYLHGLPAVSALSDPNYWANGDLNDDGVVNYIDYAIEDAAYAANAGTLADQLISLHLQEFGAPYADALGLSAIPEPASLSLLGLALPAIMIRRRQKR